jgi:hypothetical protein
MPHLRSWSGLKNTVAIREEKEGEAVFLGFGVVSASAFARKRLCENTFSNHRSYGGQAVTGFSNMLLR